MYSATFAVAWNAFVLFWTLSAASLMLSLFSLPFWAAGFMMGKCAASPCLVVPSLQHHWVCRASKQPLVFSWIGGS